MENNILKYKDTDDKCYGLTGMAVAAVVLGAEDAIYSISLDGQSEGGIEFVEGYVLPPTNPSFSPRNVWEQAVEHFRLSSGMLLANLLCRHYLYRHDRMKDDECRLVHSIVSETGRESCSLDDDEIDAVFDKTLRYFDRIFSHSGVAGVAHTFADTLKRMRMMEADDIADALAPLRTL